MISHAVATHRPTSPQPSANTAVSGIGATVVGFFRWMAAARARARTLRALNNLDDDMLKDIGLTRSQICGFEHDPRYDPNARF